MVAILDVLLPDHCVLCGLDVNKRTESLVCPYCWLALPRNLTACRQCALPLASDGICGACQQAPPPMHTSVAALLHQGPATTLVHALKFNHNLRAGVTLATAMAIGLQHVYRHQPWPELLIPMPLAYRRQVQRGFNQAAWLAHKISRQLNIPVYTKRIRRQYRRPQQSLDRKARQRLNHRLFKGHLSGDYQHVAIIDDVMTTTTSAQAFATFLQKQNIERIDCWCASRAIIT